MLFLNHSELQQSPKPNRLVAFPLKNASSNSAAEFSNMLQQESICNDNTAACS